MRINKSTSTKASLRTVNKAGGEAFAMPLKERLVSRVLTSFYNEKKYYGDNTKDMIAEIREVLDADALFIAKLAAYARNVMNLRTVPTVMVGEMALHPKGRVFLRKAMAKVITRPDQMKELVAYVNGAVKDKNGNPMNLASSIRQLKLGLSDSLNRFDEYQLAKYNGGVGLKLRDILLLSHAKPESDDKAKLFKNLLEDTLAIPMTWETEISAKGNKAEVWDNLIANKKLPYMAALRNLRNLKQSGSKQLDTVLDMIKSGVLKSKQLPFRFYSAYRENSDNIKIQAALESALETSVANLPVMEGITLTSADNSASMNTNLSQNGTISYNDIANLMQALFKKQNDANTITSVFGQEFAVVNSRGASILKMTDTYKRTNVGHSTAGWKVIKHLLDTKKRVDRIIIFTDMQLYNMNGYSTTQSIDTLFAKYRKEINPNVWLHIVDLAGYGTKPVINNNVNQMAGWSENILQYIKMVEDGVATQISIIEQTEL